MGEIKFFWQSKFIFLTAVCFEDFVLNAFIYQLIVLHFFSFGQKYWIWKCLERHLLHSCWLLFALQCWRFRGANISRHSDPKLKITFGNYWGKSKMLLLSIWCIIYSSFLNNHVNFMIRKNNFVIKRTQGSCKNTLK